jgi:serine/threonine protein kinase
MLERLGTYEILETVAAGGQGTVYRARDSGSGDVVALKVMHPGHTGEIQYLEALRQEANLASRLDDPNIVKVLDFQVEGAGPLRTVMSGTLRWPKPAPSPKGS